MDPRPVTGISTIIYIDVVGRACVYWVNGTQRSDLLRTTSSDVSSKLECSYYGRPAECMDFMVLRRRIYLL